MALIKLGAFITALSGKIGGQSISNRAQQTTIRNIVHTNKTATPKQSVQRFQTAHISNRFIFLSALQKSAWNAAAVDYEYVNRIGDTVNRNGFGTFSFLNQNLYLIGEPIKNSPPLYAAAVNPTIVIDNYGLSTLDISAADADADYTYVLFAAANMSAGASAQNGIMRFCGPISAADLLAGINIIPQIETVFDVLTFPNNIGFRIDAINTSTGNRAADAQLFTVEVVSTPVINYDPDYQAILDYAVLNGISTPTASQQDLQNQLMIDIKAALPLSAFDYLYICVTDAGNPFTGINWANPAFKSFTPLWVFNSNNYITAPSSTSAGTTNNFTPSTDAVAMTLNNAHYGFKIANFATTWGSNDQGITAIGAAGRHYQFAGNLKRCQLNGTAVATLDPTNLTGDWAAQNAYIIVNRPDAANLYLLQNGTALPNVANASTALPDVVTLFLARNGGFVTRFQAFHAGREITPTEQTDFMTAYNTYLSAI